jgi:hypothetical protein
MQGNMKRKDDSISKDVPPPPNGLDEEQEFAWKKWPEWRSVFLSKRSQTQKALLIHWLKVNLSAIFVAIIIATMFHFMTPITITNNSLLILAIGVLSASAAILTIIVAFLTFWFGSANNSMQRTRSMIRDELRNLEVIKRDIDPLTAGPKEGITGDLKNNLETLAKKSEAFLNALKILGGRFYRAALGTYYDSQDIFTLDTVIRHVGGEWFKAYLAVFKGHSEHDFCRKAWENAMGISRRLGNLNDEVMRSSTQIMQIIYFMPTLISVLFVLIFSLVIAFISSITSERNLLPVVNLVFGSILILLLVTHLVIVVRFLWTSVSSRYFSYETNRSLDIQYTTKVEQQYPLDYAGALDKHLEIIAKAYTTREDQSE